jgi:hypothetical protein
VDYLANSRRTRVQLKIAAHMQAKFPVAYNIPSWKGHDVLALQAKAKAKFPRSGLSRVRQ